MMNLYDQINSLPNKQISRRFTTIDGNNLVLFKYTKSAFFGRDWETTPAIRSARGIVFDSSTKQVVCWPFDRLDEIDIDVVPEDAILEIKVNGFMAAVWFYAGQWRVTTTGSFQSDYVELAASKLDFLAFIPDKWKSYTILFEICDPSDEHIIQESPGAYVIGARNNLTGEFLKPEELDSLIFSIAEKADRYYNVFRPNFFKRSQCNLEDFDSIEGFIVRSPSGEYLGKYKTPYYRDLKYIARTKKPINEARLLCDISKSYLNEYKSDWILTLTEFDRLRHFREYWNKAISSKYSLTDILE